MLSFLKKMESDLVVVTVGYFSVEERWRVCSIFYGEKN